MFKLRITRHQGLDRHKQALGLGPEPAQSGRTWWRASDDTRAWLHADYATSVDTRTASALFHRSLLQSVGDIGYFGSVATAAGAEFAVWFGAAPTVTDPLH